MRDQNMHVLLLAGAAAMQVPGERFWKREHRWHLLSFGEALTVTELDAQPRAVSWLQDEKF